MAPQKQSSKQRIAVLEAENIRLRSEVEKLKVKRARRADGNMPRFRLRSILIGLIVAFAGTLLVVGNVLFWASRSVTETDRYVGIVTPLIEKPEVQKAIAKKTTDALFAQVNIEQIAQEALPPRAEFLAPSIATQVQSFTNQQAEKALGTSQFKDIWVQVNTTAHEKLIQYIRNYKGDGVIDVTDIYNRLGQQLEGTKLSFLAGKQLPPQIGQITVVDAPNLPKIHWLVVNLMWLRFATILIFVALTILSVRLAANRRKMVVRLGIYYSVLMFILLLSVRIGREVMVSRVLPEYKDAASVVWQVVMHSFVIQTTGILVIGLLMSLIAWVTGNTKAALAVRSRIVELLNGKLHQSLFGEKENRFTLLIAKYKRILQWAMVIISALGLLVITLTPLSIIALATVTLLGVLVVEVLAATRK